MNESIMLLAPTLVAAISVFALVTALAGRLRTDATFDRFWDMERLTPVRHADLDPRFELPEDAVIKPENTEIEVIEAVAFDGAVWCIACLPEPAGLSDDDVVPISSLDEWGPSYPLCLSCGHEHRYIRLAGARVG